MHTPNGNVLFRPVGYISGALWVSRANLMRRYAHSDMVILSVGTHFRLPAVLQGPKENGRLSFGMAIARHTKRGSDLVVAG